MSSSQNTLDGRLMLVSTASDTHLLGQIEWTDEEHIDSRDRGNLLYILHARS